MALLSAHSTESAQCGREWEYAVHRRQETGRPHILPLRVGKEVKVPELFANTHVADQMDDRLPELIRQVRRQLIAQARDFWGQAAFRQPVQLVVATEHWNRVARKRMMASVSTLFRRASVLTDARWRQAHATRAPGHGIAEDERSRRRAHKLHAMSTQKHLVQLLLPLKLGDDNRSRLAETRQELADRFGGVTAYERSPAKGTWVSPEGSEQHDSVVMIEILVDDFDSEWWRLYAERLAARFGEQEIHVRALPAIVP